MTHHVRRQIMIDQPVQGTLIARVVWYWFLCLGSTALFAWCWMVWMNPAEDVEAGTGQRLTALIPALMGSLTVLPLAIADVIRVSNRFVGPVHSLRNAMKRLSMGDSVGPLEVRQCDYWNDLVLRFNQLLPGFQLPGTSADQRAARAGAIITNDLDCLNADRVHEVGGSFGERRDSS